MLRASLTGLVLSLGLTLPAMAEPVAPVGARFAAPTDRYPHNVLGNLPGYGALQVDVAGNIGVQIALPAARVFEDIAPRLWDIDGDGIAEIIAVESDQTLGARLTAWSVQKTATGVHHLTLRASGDFIGTRFRWLAPAGTADFTGNGTAQIAYVEMPHLAQRLVLVQLDGDRFVPIARLDGISNHRIGEEFITGGLRDCGDGPALLVPSADWDQIMRVTVSSDGRMVAEHHAPFTGHAALQAMLACGD